MTKRLYLYIVMFVVVICFGVGCEQRSVDTKSLSAINVNVEANNNDLTVITPTSSRVLAYTTSTLADENEGYSYDLKYPVFRGGDAKVRERINRAIEEYMQENLAEFVEDYETVDHEYDPEPWFLSVDYSVSRDDDAFVSVLMQGSVYTGGAHPNSFFKSFLFNLEEGGSLMEVDDVFNPMASSINLKTGSRQNYLQYLSSEAVSELTMRDISDEDWILDGAGPQKDNYNTFYLTDEQIVFIFGAYQVAPYAVGPQEIGFSYDELAAYLKAYAF